MSEYSHGCGSCDTGCENRVVDKNEFLETLNPTSSVKKVIGIVNRKGGVGESLVTSMMVVGMNRKGKEAVILDTDTTGPSILMALGLPNDGVTILSDSKLILPTRSMEGVEIASANLFLDRDTDSMIWRSPVIAGAVKQFWFEILWQDIGYVFADMLPGTGDAPLTVSQSLPVDEITIVTSPQELASMTVAKAMNMARRMDIPVVGITENMSHLECPDYGKHISVSGEGYAREVAKGHDIQVLIQIPTDPKITQMVDAGRMECMEMPWFEHAVEVAGAL